MAFATRLVNGEFTIGDCPPLTTTEYNRLLEDLSDLLRPPVQAVTFGSGKHAITIGGKYVLYRHDFTYHNPTAIAIDVADTMEPAEIGRRAKDIEVFSYAYIGRTLSLDAIAVRCASGDPTTFAAAVKTVAATTDLPLMLCSRDPVVLEAALKAVHDRRPLLYAATAQNWEKVAELALRFSCPLVASAPDDSAMLRSLARTLTEYGIDDLVLDPGTFTESGVARTLMGFTALRHAACISHDELCGHPLLGTPIAAWAGTELSPEIVQWNEATTAAMLISRYADLLVMHSMEGWVLLPQLIWRFNIYTDPRKPVSVDAGVRAFYEPDKESPLLITTNYALTYFTVESDIKAAHISCHLIVADTAGISVESAVAGRYLTAETIAAALKEYHAEELVSHRYLILPGLAARLSGEAEEASGWHMLVGPKDSSGLAQFIRDRWPPKPEE
jgi:acetyl-CoA decarbonylase/synthase complex subunit gamma